MSHSPATWMLMVLPNVLVMGWLGYWVNASNRLDPRAAARGLVMSGVLGAFMVTVSAMVLSAAWLFHQGPLGLGSHFHHGSRLYLWASVALGVLLAAWLARCAWRVLVVLRAHLAVRTEARRAALSAAGSVHWVDQGPVTVVGSGHWSAGPGDDRFPRLEITNDRAPYAYTFPGADGLVVASIGLRDLLTDGEFAVVLEHERAHSRARHDRYRLIGACLSAVSSWFKPLVQRLDLALECWADEEAVHATGHSRRFVARTVARVGVACADFEPSPGREAGGAVSSGALMSAGARWPLGGWALDTNWSGHVSFFAHSDVVARADALLRPVQAARSWRSAAALSFFVAAMVPTLAAQGHHLAVAFSWLCS